MNHGPVQFNRRHISIIYSNHATSCAGGKSMSSAAWHIYKGHSAIILAASQQCVHRWSFSHTHYEELEYQDRETMPAMWCSGRN